MSLCLEVACSCAGLLGPVALLGISTLRRGGNKKVYTRAAHCFDWKRGSDGCLLGLFLFCFDVRPRSDPNPIKGLFVPPGTAEGNI